MPPQQVHRKRGVAVLGERFVREERASVDGDGAAADRAGTVALLDEEAESAAGRIARDRLRSGKIQRAGSDPARAFGFGQSARGFDDAAGTHSVCGGAGEEQTQGARPRVDEHHVGRGIRDARHGVIRERGGVRDRERRRAGRERSLGGGAVARHDDLHAVLAQDLDERPRAERTRRFGVEHVALRPLPDPGQQRARDADTDQDRADHHPCRHPPPTARDRGGSIRFDRRGRRLRRGRRRHEDTADSSGRTGRAARTVSSTAAIRR